MNKEGHFQLFEILGELARYIFELADPAGQFCQVVSS